MRAGLGIPARQGARARRCAAAAGRAHALPVILHPTLASGAAACADGLQLVPFYTRSQECHLPTGGESMLSLNLSTLCALLDEPRTAATVSAGL